MPGPLWHGATHFGFDCRIEGVSAAQANRFCGGLGPTGAKSLALPFRAAPGVDGVTLRMTMRRAGNRLMGTLIAIRPALRGETDEQSPPVLLALDAGAPSAGFARALAALRAPPARPRVPRAA